MIREEYVAKTKNKKERVHLAESLKTLLESRGWEILVLHLEAQRDYLQDKVNNLDTPEQHLQRARIELFYCNKVLGMPKKLVKLLLESKGEDLPIDDRVYD